MDVHGRLRQLMGQRGWSPYKLAKMAGLPQSSVSNLFQRNNLPTLPTLEAICGAFGITMAEFFSQEEDPCPLTAAQKRLLYQWGLLTPQQQEALLHLMQTMQ